ncbi:hypothetical protein ACFQ07_29520 [Actinomadura adrarensis]|uniref:TerB family tellurite resistance protein n=1 Tax=Actinomadura adrarensis TaxID=1819600 RepID=A0ABW3CPE9_9ACTN
MPVNEKEFSALLALLSGRSEEHNRLLDELDPAEQARGYSALIAAGMFELAEKRFIRDGKYAPRSEVLAYVAHARGKSDDFADELDPRIAERVLLCALDEGEIDDIDNSEAIKTQLWLLGALVDDEEFSRDELHSFLKLARRTADEWLEPEP